MSGRAHIFMLPKQVAELAELVTINGVADDKYGKSHVIQVAVDWLLDRDQNGLLSPEEIALLTKVPTPPNHGHLHVFLRQVSINFLFKLIQKYDIQSNDYAFSHVLTTAFGLMLAAQKAATLSEQNLKDLRTVKAPKTVLHS